MKRYYDEMDSDFVMLYWLEKDDMYDLGLTELDIPKEEWDKYLEVVDYIENFHKKIEEWKV